MLKKILSSFCFLLLIHAAVAQRCADGVIARPDLQKRHQVFQNVLEQYAKNPQRNSRIQEEIIKIPVVIHIIHDQVNGEIGGELNPNVSDEQVFSQIRVLNEDFRKKAGTLGFNGHEDGADMEIEFVLASFDPSGNPTSGITRSYYNEKSFDVFSDLELVSSISYWDSEKYLNIWVLDLSGSFLGYGEFPSAALDGLELTDPPAATDGVFIDYQVFGSRTGTANSGIYSYGRTLTHEIGHWLGLIHIWGDSRCGDDYIDDTPQAQRENDSETCRDIFSRCSGESTRNMIENYMDYTPDSCMNIFTQDQKVRVRQVLEISQRRRRLVLNSQSLLPNSEIIALKVLNNPAPKEDLSFQVLLPGFQDFSLQFYDNLGREVAYKEFLDYPSTVVKGTALNLPKGVLILRMKSGTTEIFKKVLVL